MDERRRYDVTERKREEREGRREEGRREEKRRKRRGVTK